jgi:hypothetical protein
MAAKRKVKKPTTSAKATTKSNRNRNRKQGKGSKNMNGQNDNTEDTGAPIRALLTSIDNKLAELVQIETYLANRVLENSKPTPAPVAAAAPVLASVPAVAAPGTAAPAQPSAPASRPGSGTVGGLVWDYCDGLLKQLGRAPTKEELLAAIKQYSPTMNGQPVNELTAATQYSKWRGSQGLPKLPRGFGAQRQAAAPAAQPVPSTSTIGVTPDLQPRAAVARAMPALPVQLPIPAAAVPSVIQPVPPAPTPAPVAVAAASLPPWLRGQG